MYIAFLNVAQINWAEVMILSFYISISTMF